MLVTAVAIALLCLAAWMLYKRFSARFKTQPADQEEDFEEYEDDGPTGQEAVADPIRPESPAALDSKKDA